MKLKWLRYNSEERDIKTKFYLLCSPLIPGQTRDLLELTGTSQHLQEYHHHKSQQQQIYSFLHQQKKESSIETQKALNTQQLITHREILNKGKAELF